jgi:hypothetical protein
MVQGVSDSKEKKVYNFDLREECQDKDKKVCMTIPHQVCTIGCHMHANIIGSGPRLYAIHIQDTLWSPLVK